MYKVTVRVGGHKDPFQDLQSVTVGLWAEEELRQHCEVRPEQRVDVYLATVSEVLPVGAVPTIAAVLEAVAAEGFQMADFTVSLAFAAQTDMEYHTVVLCAPLKRAVGVVMRPHGNLRRFNMRPAGVPVSPNWLVALVPEM